MKSLRLFKKRLQEAEVGFTDSLDTAMFLLPDGSMIDGEFDLGMRGQDHRIIFAGVNNYPDYYEVSNPASLWDRLHKEYKVVRLVPESDIALIKSRQKLTDEQKRILSRSNYEIEKY